MILISASKINSGQTKEHSQIQTINPYCRGWVTIIINFQDSNITNQTLW
jgi:hypothetical protein